MKRREAAIISAYTGTLIGNFSDLHEYAEELLNRPIFTHEFARKEIADKIKEAARKDFMELNQKID